MSDVRESKQLVNNPCRLVSPPDSFDRDMQRIMRMTQQDYEAPKKILELNRKHGVVANLAKILNGTPDDALLNPTIEQLFANALILEGIHPNPTDMVEHIQTLMDAAVASRV